MTGGLEGAETKPQSGTNSEACTWPCAVVTCLSPGKPRTSIVVKGTTRRRGLCRVHTTGRGEIANEVTQGDLVESRVVLAHDAKPVWVTG